MSKRAAAALVCTFLGLLVATMWVPGTIWTSQNEPVLAWVPITVAMRTGIRWPILVVEFALIIAVGGLLGLFLRTRQTRGAA